MSKRQKVRAIVVGLLVVGTTLGVAGGVIDGEWTTAATGFAALAGADLLWTHVYAQPPPAPGRRTVSLGLLALALVGLVAAFLVAPAVQRVGLALVGAGVVMGAAAALHTNRRGS